jgi:hypothetical protein
MKKIIGFLFLFLLVGTAYGYWKYFYTFSSGERCGILQKFSHKGNIFKTYEGELILSSIQSSGGMGLASEKFFFSVANTDVANKLKAMDGQRVCLQYTEKNGTLPWRGETNYVIEDLKMAAPQNQIPSASAEINAPATTTPATTQPVQQAAAAQ